MGVDVRAAARPTRLRTSADEPGEEGELTGWASGFLGDCWGGRLELTVVANPHDDDTFRYDGSCLAGLFGNWIVTVGAQDRWRGSGSLAGAPSTLRDLALTHESSHPWGTIAASLGYSDVDATGPVAVEDGVRGFVTWRHVIR